MSSRTFWPFLDNINSSSKGIASRYEHLTLIYESYLKENPFSFCACKSNLSDLLLLFIPCEELGSPEVELEVDNEAASGFRTLFSNSRLSLILRSPASRNL